MLKKVFTLFLSVIILLSVGTITTVNADVKSNVEQVLQTITGDGYPTTKTNAWTNENGAESYANGGSKLNFAKDASSVETEEDLTDISVTLDSGDYIASDVAIF